MFKLVVLSCLVSVAFAGYVPAPIQYAAHVKTVVEPSYTVVETPTVNHVATVVKSVPSAVSHQSQTLYHSKSYVEPIYAHGVEKSVISTPIVKNIVEKVIAPAYVAAPAHYVQEPIAYKSYAPAPAYSYAQHAAPIAYAQHAAPIKYVQEPIAYSAYAPAAYSYAQHAPAAYSAYPAPAHYAHAPASYAHHY